MNIQSILVVYHKELRDILRDRRTLFSMILLPILIFPILMLGSGAFMKHQIEKIQEKTSMVAFVGPSETDYLAVRIEAIDGIQLLNLGADSALGIEMIRDKEIEAFVFVPDNFQVAIDAALLGDTTESVPQISLFSNETRTQSGFAVKKVSRVFQDFRTEIAEDALASFNLSPKVVKPFLVAELNVASPKEMGRFLAGSFLPYILILMSLTGAMYAAIDLTAGEKERGTLETLLVAGVSRMDIVLGKFLTVFTASVVTTLLAVGSMTGTSVLTLKMMPEVAGVLQFSIGLFEVFLMLVAMIPLAAIFSSLLMTLALFAKSYREAQTYISPLMFIVIFPAMASMMPDSETSRQAALIPVINVSLMMKDGLSGNIDPVVITLTMVVNIVLAVLGLLLVQQMFKRESVLFRI